MPSAFGARGLEGEGSRRRPIRHRRGYDVAEGRGEAAGEDDSAKMLEL